MSLLTPNNRQEMERHVGYMLEHAYGHIERKTEYALVLVYPHLRELRYLPNRRLNVETVNESLRLMANMQASFQTRADGADDTPM